MVLGFGLKKVVYDGVMRNVLNISAGRIRPLQAVFAQQGRVEIQAKQAQVVLGAPAC